MAGFTLNRILETVIYCDDVAEARAFYVGLLNREPAHYEPEEYVFFRLESQVLLIFNPHASRSQEKDVNGATIPQHGGVGDVHLAFEILLEDMEESRRHLASLGIVIESEVDWPNGGRSIYFRDPSGNSVELVTKKLWFTTCT